MPELPEVETTVRGIKPHVVGKKILGVNVHNPNLRWPVSPEFEASLPGKKILSVRRRAKYLVFETAVGGFILHLGMSGSLRICRATDPLLKHDHLVFELAQQRHMRLNDPRRFGCALWAGNEPEQHPLLNSLGLEPLGAEIDPLYLYEQSRGKKSPVKNFIMDNGVIVGVGNIYASESLFMSGIRPRRAAGRLNKNEASRLLYNIQEVLRASIELGGSTLRDFVSADGTPGYFQQTLRVYGRKDEPCLICSSTIKSVVIGQRSSFYCPQCQK